MAKDFLIPVELKGVLMDADWIYRTRGFLTRGVAMAKKIKAVGTGGSQVMMNYGAQHRYLPTSQYYTSWPCYLEWDYTVTANPRTRYAAEVDRDFLCYVLGFYSIKYDHNLNVETDEHGKPVITYNHEDLDKYLHTLKKCRMFTLVLSYDYEQEGEFYKSLKLNEPKHL